MLELRPGCECCNRDLPPDSALAMICSFECTFCQPCVQEKLKGMCPNCGGGLVLRPVRLGSGAGAISGVHGAYVEAWRLHAQVLKRNGRTGWG